VLASPAKESAFKPLSQILISSLFSSRFSHQTNEWQSPIRGLGGEIIFPPGKRCLSEASCFSQGKLISPPRPPMTSHQS
ncbi:MAG: hypothetical protein ACPG9R_02605, partial [Marinobacter salsuginis]